MLRIGRHVVLLEGRDSKYEQPVTGQSERLLTLNILGGLRGSHALGYQRLLSVATSLRVTCDDLQGNACAS